MNGRSDRAGDSARPHIVWPTFFLILVFVYSYLTWRPALQSTRPVAVRYYSPPPPSAEGISATHARLWQDPLAAAYRTAQRPPAQSSSVFNQLLTGPRGRAQKQCQRERLKAYFRQIALAAQEPSNTREEGGLLVMPVFLPGGPYAEDREQRIRTRYAVLSALHICGFRFTFPTRMSFIELPVRIDIRALDTTRDIDFVVPVKLFQPTERPKKCAARAEPKFSRVLVFWINDTQLGDRPLNVVGQFLSELFSYTNKQNIPVRIIGPTCTDGLNAMREELNCPPTALMEFAEVHVYSPRATGLPELSKELADRDASKKNVKLIRAIGTDEQLVRAIACELHKRRAWPSALCAATKEDLNTCAASKLDDDSQKSNLGPKRCVVLVTESDTQYGRELVNLFTDLLPPENGGDRDSRVQKEWLMSLTYLRGLDGALPASETTENQTTDRKPDDKMEDQGQALLAQGRSQYDYLRRLEGQLVDFEQELRSWQSRISAIGVVGTDVYDKLLVLRALRRRFPHAYFFTTDLDARFWDSAEFSSARNLLVASHFGLQLSPCIQGGRITFRDSYQTSTFFACRLALDDPTFDKIDDNIMEDPWGLRSDDAQNALRPLIFEIGRQGAYQLSIPERRGGSLSPKVHPPSPRAPPSGRWWLFVLGKVFATVLLALFPVLFAYLHLSAVRRIVDSLLRMPGRIAAYLFFVLLWTTFMARLLRASGRPQGRARRKGASIAVLRAKSWIAARRITNPHAPWWSGKKRTPPCLAAWCWEETRTRVAYNLFMFIAVVVTVVLIVTIWSHHWDEAGEPFSIVEGISIWPSTLIRYAAAVLAIAFLIKGTSDLTSNRVQISKEYGIGATDSSSAGRTVIGSPSRGTGSLYSFAWLAERLAPTFPIAGREERTQTLYARYSQLASASSRVTRFIVLTAVFMVSVFCLFYYTTPPNLPHRGGASRYLSMGILYLAVGATIALTLFVLDATQLCRRFVKELSERKDDWRTSGGELAASERALPSAERHELLRTQLIAVRTHAVGNLMRYPFVVVLLLILSRSPFLDNFDFPLPLAAIIGVIFLATVGSAFALRREAKQGRRRILRRLHRRLQNAVASDDEARERQLNEWISEIEAEDQGAFRPLTQDWLFSALAVPLGGASGLFVLEAMLT